MENLSFSSDTTFCSMIEKSKTINKKKPTKSSLIEDFLNKVHESVLRHFEANELLGNIQVSQYLKEISEMKLRSYKHKYFAEKIKASLVKIYRLNKTFEKIVSHRGFSSFSDPLSNCDLAKDLEPALLKPSNEVPQIFRFLCAGSSNEHSFSSNMLSNKNFISDPTKITNLDEELKERGELTIKSNLDSKNYSGSGLLQETVKGVDVFNFPKSISQSEVKSVSSPVKYIKVSESFCESSSTQSENFIIETSAGASSEDSCTYKENKENYTIIDSTSSVSIDNDMDLEIISSTQSEVGEAQNVHSKIFAARNVFKKPLPVVKRAKTSRHLTIQTTRNTNLVINNNESKLSHNVLQSFSEASQQVMGKNTMNNSESVCVKDAETPLNQRVIDESYSLDETATLIIESSQMDISESEDDIYVAKSQSGKLKDATDELTSIVSKIKVVEQFKRKLDSSAVEELGNGTKTWNEVHDELEYANEVVRGTTDKLSELLEDVTTEKELDKEKEFEEMLQNANLHNFDAEDAAKLDLRGLMLTNAAELEKISIQFKGLLLMEDFGLNSDKNDEDEDYSRLDWRNLL